MRELTLLYRQIGYERKSYFRNPAAAGFSFIFPVMFLVIFGVLYGSKYIDIGTMHVKGIQYSVPQILVFSVVGTTFVSLVINLSLRRDSGELKRKRGTPVSPGVILGGVVGNGVLMSLIMTVLVLAIGVIIFGVHVDIDRLPTLIVTVILGAVSFCALGAAVAALVPNGDAAPAFANIVIFPLYFLSGVFIPDIPKGIANFAEFLPLRPFLQALFRVFDLSPAGTATPDWGHLAVVLAWGAVGAVVAIRFFRWTPRR
jgi:ABC-2 type transport system permease protein